MVGDGGAVGAAGAVGVAGVLPAGRAGSVVAGVLAPDLVRLTGGGAGGGRRAPEGGEDGDVGGGGEELSPLIPASEPSPGAEAEVLGGPIGKGVAGGDVGGGGADPEGTLVGGDPGGRVTAGPRIGAAGIGGGTTISARAPEPPGAGVVDAAPMIVAVAFCFPGSGGGAPAGEGSGGGMLSQPPSISIESAL
jgi:hypothetical protein